MTPQQREHMIRLMEEFNNEFSEKYKAGCIEHKGLLAEVPIKDLVKFAKEEVIDQVSYVWTLSMAVDNLLEENESLRRQLDGKVQG